MLFAAAFKVYSTVSARRFMTRLRDACADGHLAHAPHYNSIFNYLESETLTPIIHRLIEESSAPLSAVETDFAVDSTGFGTSQFFRYYDAKYGKDGARGSVCSRIQSSASTVARTTSAKSRSPKLALDFHVSPNRGTSLLNRHHIPAPALGRV